MATGRPGGAGIPTGVPLAVAAVLVLTPDTLLMRLSGLGGLQMVAWRGLLMGAVLLAVWATTSRSRRRDLAILASGGGLAVVACQWLNATLFSVGVSVAPVAVVLFAVAAVPVLSALIGAAFLDERAGRVTWATIAAVLTGIGLAVFSGEGGGALVSAGALWGAACGLAVALSMAATFALMRAKPEIPVFLVVGLGAGLSGLNGLLMVGPQAMFQGSVWPIVVAGAVVLPFSFGAMTIAARHTAGVNVSLILLLETVLGPLWVWWGIGEPVPPLSLVGGGIVVTSLCLYLLHRRAAQRQGAGAAAPQPGGV